MASVVDVSALGVKVACYHFLTLLSSKAVAGPGLRLVTSAGSLEWSVQSRTYEKWEVSHSSCTSRHANTTHRPIRGQCRVDVVDGGPTLVQHCVDVSSSQALICSENYMAIVNLVTDQYNLNGK